MSTSVSGWTQVELERWLDDAEAQLGSIGLGLDTLDKNVDAQRASIDELQEHIVDRLATLVDRVLKQPDVPVVAEEKTKNPVPDVPVAEQATRSAKNSKASAAKKSKAEPAPVKRLNVSRKEAAIMLGVCEGSIDNYIDKGLLKRAKKSRRVLISVAEVERFAAVDDPEPVRPVGPRGPKPVTSVKDPKPLVKPKRG
jgi:hypothetical protein